MANRELVGDGLVERRRVVIGQFGYLKFGLKNRQWGAISQRCRCPICGIAQLKQVIQRGAVLIAGDVKYIYLQLDQEGVIGRVVVVGCRRVAKCEREVTTAATSHADGGGRQCACKICAQQAAACCCSGDHLMADIFQSGWKVIEHHQVLRDTLGEGDEQIECRLSSDHIAAWIELFIDSWSG